jgi:hypothetical protein
VLSENGEVKCEMQTSSVKTTLAKMLSAGKRFSKIRAALPTNVVPGVSESESGNQSESTPVYFVTREFRIAQLELQAQRARDEAMAGSVRRRLM